MRLFFVCILLLINWFSCLKFFWVLIYIYYCECSLMNIVFHSFNFLLSLGRVVDLHFLFFSFFSFFWLNWSNCLLVVRNFLLRCWSFFPLASELGYLYFVQMWLLLDTTYWQLSFLKILTCREWDIEGGCLDQDHRVEYSNGIEQSW